MGDERCGIYLSLFDQTEYLGAIASIHSTCLESQILTIHVGQRKHLRTVVEGYDGDHSIGACALPCQAEAIVRTSYFYYHIGASMKAVRKYKVLTRVGSVTNTSG